MAESRITDFFAAAPSQKKSRQESSDSDSETVSVPCPLPSTASDTSVSTGTTGSVAVFTRKGKHKLGYNPKWNEEFNWLEYRMDATDGRGGLYCTLCRKVQRTRTQ